MAQERLKKQDQGANKKEQRMRKQTADQQQNVDRPDVHQTPSDEYDQTLNKDSKATKRGDSNRVTKKS
jgi:hypothetical protein